MTTPPSWWVMRPSYMFSNQEQKLMSLVPMPPTKNTIEKHAVLFSEAFLLHKLHFRVQTVTGGLPVRFENVSALVLETSFVGRNRGEVLKGKSLCEARIFLFSVKMC